MAKKIRFPLEMENKVEVRSMEEFREHFSLEKVMEYVKNGKLEIWLRDRYENELADKVAGLNEADEELSKKVSEIFEVPYDESLEENLKKAEERTERINKLKEFTEEERFLSKIDQVAFDQEELYDLLDEEVKEIYLCGDKFSIPLSLKGITYRGVNRPIVVIDSKERVDWDSKEITLENVRFDERYQTVEGREDTDKDMKKVDTVKEKISVVEIKKKAVSELYGMAEREILQKEYHPENLTKEMKSLAREILEIKYHPEDITREMKQMVYDSHLIGIAEGKY